MRRLRKLLLRFLREDDSVLLLRQEVLKLQDRIADIQKDLEIAQITIIEVSRLTGGSGWIEAAQDAIKALDERVESIEDMITSEVEQQELEQE